MKFKTLMIIKALVCLVFGPVLLFIPGQLVKMLGSTLIPGVAFTANLYAATLFGNLMLTWFARNAETSMVRRAIILHLFVYDLVALVATLIFLISGDLNHFGWGIVSIYLFFTVGFGYFLFKRRKVQ